MNSVEDEAGDSGEALRTEEGELQPTEVQSQNPEESAAPIFETEESEQASCQSGELEPVSWRVMLIAFTIGLFMIGIGVAGYAQYSLFSDRWQNGVYEIQKGEAVKDFRERNFDYYAKHGSKRPASSTRDDYWATQSRIESLESRQEANRDRRSEYLVIRTVGFVILVVAIILALIMFLVSRSPQPGPQPE